MTRIGLRHRFGHFVGSVFRRSRLRLRTLLVLFIVAWAAFAVIKEFSALPSEPPGIGALVFMIVVALVFLAVSIFTAAMLWFGLPTWLERVPDRHRPKASVFALVFVPLLPLLVFYPRALGFIKIRDIYSIYEYIDQHGFFVAKLFIAAIVCAWAAHAVESDREFKQSGNRTIRPYLIIFAIAFGLKFFGKSEDPDRLLQVAWLRDNELLYLGLSYAGAIGCGVGRRLAET